MKTPKKKTVVGLKNNMLKKIEWNNNTKSFMALFMDTVQMLQG